MSSKTKMDVSGIDWPADKVQRTPLSDLIPYARNARRHSDEQVKQIASLVTELGWTVPVVVDEAGEILAGHGRVLAAEYLGLSEIPVIVASGWTEEQKRLYRIADNQVALGSDWDEAILKAELESLRDDGADLALTGFDEKEIDKLLKVLEAPDEFAEFDEAIETEHKCPKCGYAWSGKAS